MITNRLLKLARAMAEFEGWHYPDGPRGQYLNGSLAWQNHNPGNLTASPFAIGKQKGFAVFVNDEVGFFAMVRDLWKKCSSETSTMITKKSTIYDLIKVYSGENAEIVTKYSRFIEQRTGFLMTMRLEEILK